MAINDKNPQYLNYYSDWVNARNANRGQTAIHKAGKTYLPELSGQDSQEYNAYLTRATFYEATGRTTEGLTGMIFRKEPLIDVGGMEEFCKDVTLGGQSLRDYAKDIVEENVTIGRVGVLVDYPQTEGIKGISKAEAKALNLRPYLITYKAEQIINWKVGQFNNAGKTMQVRLLEEVEVEGEKEFEIKFIEQIRVLEIVNKVYQQRIFRQNTKKEWEQYGSEIVPLKNGQPLDSIPFVFISPKGTSTDVEKCPINGLVNLNISHYKTTADFEHGCHFTGLPTPIITGFEGEEMTDGEKQEYKIGSTIAWTFGNPDTKAFYLEFEGKGLDSLKENLKAKEEKMASLGAQMLMPTEKRQETTETATIRHMGENSILSSISMSVSEALNIVLEIAGDWLGVKPATISLNKDFMPQSMTPQMMKELFAGVQGGFITQQTLFENLQRGEIIDAQKNYDEYISELETLPDEEL